MIWGMAVLDTHTNTHTEYTRAHFHPVSYSEHGLQSVTNTHPHAGKHRHAHIFVWCACQVADRIKQSRVLWPGQNQRSLLPVLKAQDRQHDKRASLFFCHRLFLSAVKHKDHSYSKAHWKRFWQTFSQMYFQSLLHFKHLFTVEWYLCVL